MKRSADVFRETCPWCEQEYDETRHIKAVIKPCKHNGCVTCLLRVLRTEKGPHPCKHAGCGRALKTFSAVQAESDEPEQAPRTMQPIAKAEADPQEDHEEVAPDGEEEVAPVDETSLEWLIKQCIDYEPPDDLRCSICTFPYDCADRQPVQVSRCYALKRDPYNEDETVDRGDVPGCGHVMCNKCMQQLLLGSKDECYFCRGCVKEAIVDEPLLRAILDNRHYAALITQLNNAMEKNDLAQNVDVKALQINAKEAKDKAAHLAQELLRANTAIADYKKREETMADQLREMTSMNGTLFDEVIDMRLERRDPARLGITATRSGSSIYLNVALQSRTIPKNERRTLLYVRTVEMVDKAGMSAIREIGEAVRSQTDLPDQATIDASYIDMDAAAASSSQSGASQTTGKKRQKAQMSVTMVERGSWLHAAINGMERTPESILGGMEEEETGKQYQRVSRVALDTALGHYRRSVAAAATGAAANGNGGLTSLGPAGGGPLKCLQIGPYMYRIPVGVHGRFSGASLSPATINQMREQLTEEILGRRLTLDMCDKTITGLVNDILRGRYPGDGVVSAWKRVEKRLQILRLLWEVACHERAPQIFLEHPPECFIGCEIDVPEAVFSKMPPEILERWKACIHRHQQTNAHGKYTGMAEYIDTLLSVLE